MIYVPPTDVTGRGRDLFVCYADVALRILQIFSCACLICLLQFLLLSHQFFFVCPEKNDSIYIIYVIQNMQKKVEIFIGFSVSISTCFRMGRRVQLLFMLSMTDPAAYCDADKHEADLWCWGLLDP